MIKTTSAFLALLALGACASEIGYHTGSLSAANERHGDAVRQNIAVQTVNPAGSSADVVASGARVAKAVSAYTADKVEKPGSAGTTSVGAQSGAQPAAK